MADDGDRGEEEDAEDVAERQRGLNPELLSACMKNDTDRALSLIEQQADPRCEDTRQWSPLIWAASHGNETLTRLLISKNAAMEYAYDDSNGKVRRKKHSPLHWAAFKGHLKVLWLLMAPPQNLSHHERDAIGNTALHQAAAGGSLECCKCLMAQGVDVFAKNDRGHTPFLLCTVQEVQTLLEKAMTTLSCKATGRQFSSTVLRYLCSWSLDVFCESAVTLSRVYETPFSTEKEKPVTWCSEKEDTIKKAENQLNQAMHLNQLDVITAALDAAADKPVDCKLVYQCSQVKAKLEAEIELGKAMKVQTVTNLDEFVTVHEALSIAIEDSEYKNADESRITAAKNLRRKLMSEASLMRAVEGPQKTTPGHILMLEELHESAEAENANEDLLNKAQKLIRKLKSERQIQHRIADVAPLVEFASFKDVLATSEPDKLPQWSHNTAEYDKFHAAYKSDLEEGEAAMISEELKSTAMEQLEKLEFLLVEKKQAEAEQGLKAAKKKKGKK